ncbi:MAG: PH domain-containing protein [Anaerolineales bacterium]
MIFQGGLSVLLGLVGLWNLWQMAEASEAADVIRYLLFALLVLLPLLLLVYRLRALQRSRYIIERDGIRLRWGLRAVDLPMNTIDWVHPREDLLTALPMPPIRWPGSIFGISMRPLPGAARVEYLASTTRQLVLIGTPERVYAISPQDSEAFLAAYQHAIEMGSLSPIPPLSEQPSFLLAEVWRSQPTRYLLLAAVLLAMVLFIWVSLLLPTLEGVRLGPTGSPQELLPATALLLLPFLNATFLVLDWSLGLYFYRHERRRPLAYLLWSASVVTGALFLMTLPIILRSS